MFTTQLPVFCVCPSCSGGPRTERLVAVIIVNYLDIVDDRGAQGAPGLFRLTRKSVLTIQLQCRTLLFDLLLVVTEYRRRSVILLESNSSSDPWRPHNRHPVDRLVFTMILYLSGRNPLKVILGKDATFISYVPSGQ